MARGIKGDVSPQSLFYWNTYCVMDKFKCLACTGGYLEQPNRIMEGVQLCFNVVREKEYNDNLKVQRDMALKRARNGR